MPAMSDVMRKIARMLLADPTAPLRMSITELAGRAGTSPATVTRFCRHDRLRRLRAVPRGRRHGRGPRAHPGRDRHRLPPDRRAARRAPHAAQRPRELAAGHGGGRRPRGRRPRRARDRALPAGRPVRHRWQRRRRGRDGAPVLPDRREHPRLGRRPHRSRQRVDARAVRRRARHLQQRRDDRDDRDARPCSLERRPRRRDHQSSEHPVGGRRRRVPAGVGPQPVPAPRGSVHQARPASRPRLHLHARHARGLPRCSGQAGRLRSRGGYTPRIRHHHHVHQEAIA